MIARLRSFFREDLSTANLTERLLALRGDRVAVHLEAPIEYGAFRSDRLTYGDIDSLVRRFSAVFARVGVTAGEHVVVATSNRFDHLLLCLAAMRMGAVAVPLGHLVKAEELRWVVESSGARTLVLDGPVYRRAFREGQPLPRVPRLLVSGNAADAPPFGVSIDAALDLRHPVPPMARVGRDDVAAILFSSGTTGLPKGAMLTSGGLLDRTRFALLFRPTQRPVVMALPLAQIMGIVSSLLPLVAGIPIHFLSKFDAERILQVIEERRATFFVGVPTMYRILAEAGLDRFDLSSVRAWFSAADVMPPELMAEFKRRGCLFDLGPLRTEALFVDAYGSVELAGAAMVRISPPGISRLDDTFVGILIPPYRARIVGEDGRDVPRGELGELWIKGPGLLRGYVGDEIATLDVRVDGWVRTGDVAFRDRIGLIHFVDRLKDVIKCGGYSVFPAEIERVLCERAEVDFAVAFGVPHPTKSETPVAAVTLKPGAEFSPEALVEHVRARLSDYKTPRRVFVLQPQEVVHGRTRKALRAALAERFAGVLEEERRSQRRV